MNWTELRQLYDASRSNNPKVKSTAEAAITANVDGWIAEYLAANLWEDDSQWGSLSRKKGDPRFVTDDDLASDVIFRLVRKPSESVAEFLARGERLKADKLGILIRHHLIRKAEFLRTSDYDFVRLFGDEFSLALWPPHGKELGLPEPTPREVVL
ncbi:MAG TPA: hypothetical protein VFO39_02265 [Candidatus Sulfotelmatobacter sp.]|nr:hypothetical protein [Candidatus Sulfotelmatobacter sp.]